MKTAMQELIEIFNHELKLGESTLSNDEGYMLKWAIFNAKTLIEKEKEQIKKAFEFGVADAYNFIEDEAEEYYNQTYDQKQHIIDIMKADEDDGLYNQNEI
jgi:hypothetical protein